MPTLKQQKVAKELINNLKSKGVKNGGKILADVGYSKAIQKNPKMILESEGVQEALEDYGFTEDNAKKVVSQILHHSKNDMARLKASEQIFKVQGSYAPEKRESVNYNLNENNTVPQKQLLVIVAKADEDLKKLLSE